MIEACHEYANTFVEVSFQLILYLAMGSYQMFILR